MVEINTKNLQKGKDGKVSSIGIQKRWNTKTAYKEYICKHQEAPAALKTNREFYAK